MTRFEYLKNNLTQIELARYIAEKEDCKGECREFCNKYFDSFDEDDRVNIGCVDVIYEYLGLDKEE